MSLNLLQSVAIELLLGSAWSLESYAREYGRISKAKHVKEFRTILTQLSAKPSQARLRALWKAHKLIVSYGSGKKPLPDYYRAAHDLAIETNQVFDRIAGDAGPSMT